MNVRSLNLFKSLKVNLGPKVANLLRDAIVQGEFRPGGRLNETLIASRLGVSKSPIREALRILESEDLVETRDRRGTFVKNLSVKDIEEIYTVLKVVDGAAVRLAVENMNDKRQKELKSIINHIERWFDTRDIVKASHLGRRFHEFNIKASENSLLMRIRNFLTTQETRFRSVAFSTGKAEVAESFKEHIAIGKALLKGDASEAELLMNNHLDKARLRVLKALQQRDGTLTKPGRGKSERDKEEKSDKVV